MDDELGRSRFCSKLGDEPSGGGEEESEDGGDGGNSFEERFVVSPEPDILLLLIILLLPLFSLVYVGFKLSNLSSTFNMLTKNRVRCSVLQMSTRNLNIETTTNSYAIGRKPKTKR